MLPLPSPCCMVNSRSHSPTNVFTSVIQCVYLCPAMCRPMSRSVSTCFPHRELHTTPKNSRAPPQRARTVSAIARTPRLAATAGVFSMDGHIAPLKDICALARAHGAVVFVDECHATGFLGPTGRGTDEYWGVRGQVDIINSTLGKALGGATGACWAGLAGADGTDRSVWQAEQMAWLARGTDRSAGGLNGEIGWRRRRRWPR
jgi:Aminotransferase class I and II